jgi:hypothetical protein
MERRAKRGTNPDSDGDESASANRPHVAFIALEGPGPLRGFATASASRRANDQSPINVPHSRVRR